MLLMGKSTISMAMFNSYVNVYQRVDTPSDNLIFIRGLTNNLWVLIKFHAM